MIIIMKNGRVLCSFPLANQDDSMPAPLILGPTCIVLILIPTRYPFCSGCQMWKTQIWKPPISYFPSLMYIRTEKAGLSQGVNWQVPLKCTTNSHRIILNIPCTYYNSSPNPWQGIGPDPDKDLGNSGVVYTEKYILQFWDLELKFVFIKTLLNKAI